MKFLLTLFILFSWFDFVQPNEGTGVTTGEAKKATEVSDSKQTDDGRRPLAIIRRFNPEVLIRSIGKDEWEPAKVAYPLFNADSLVTTDTGFAMIQFMDNSIVRMRPNSLLVIGGESKSRESTVTRLTMEAGEIFVSVTGLGESTEVVTPSAVAAVRGTNFAILLSGGQDDSCDEDESNNEESDNDDTSDDIRKKINDAKNDKHCDDDGNPLPNQSVIIGFDGQVEITPNEGEGSYFISGGQVIFVDEDGNVLEGTLSEEELAELLDDYLSDDSARTRTRTLELRFVNEDGEVEIITIEFEEEIENE